MVAASLMMNAFLNGWLRRSLAAGLVAVVYGNGLLTGLSSRQRGFAFGIGRFVGVVLDDISQFAFLDQGQATELNPLAIDSPVFKKQRTGFPVGHDLKGNMVNAGGVICRDYPQCMSTHTHGEAMILVVVRQAAHIDITDLVSGNGVVKGHKEARARLVPPPLAKLKLYQAHEHFFHGGTVHMFTVQEMQIQCDYRVS